MNDIKTAFLLACKSVSRGSKFTLVFLVLILSLAYFNMMFVSGILQGLSELIPQVTIDEVSSHFIITPQEQPRVKQFIINQADLRTRIEAIPGILATTRRYALAGSLAFDKDKSGQYKSLSAGIVGIDPVSDAKVLVFRKYLRYGRFIAESDTDQIVLSSALAGGYGDIAADNLGGVKVGDKINVTYVNGTFRTYTVKGIYHDSMAIMENFVSAREAESVLGVNDNASQILVKADLKASSLDKYLQKIKVLTPNLKVQTYKEQMGTFGSFVNALRLITIILSIISITVAAVTIFILFYINAIHKRRQIGILKAIGIKQKIIVFSYLFQAIFYTAVSLGVGSLFIFGLLYPLFLKYPLDVDFGKVSLVFTWVEILASTTSFAVTGVLAGIIPSALVAKEDILTAIWG